MDNVWHVLDVIEGSPAESAGLVPMGDWVLGWSGGVLSQENDFYELVEAVSLTCACIYAVDYMRIFVGSLAYCGGLLAYMRWMDVG